MTLIPDTGRSRDARSRRSRGARSWAAFALALAVLALAPALARVPLGATVPAEARAALVTTPGASPPAGPYLIAFHTRGCAEVADLERHWAALRASGLPVLAVNPPEPGLVPLTAPPGLPGLGGAPALALSRGLKVRAYPTTLLVDGADRVRDALEGPLTLERVRASLNLLRERP